MKAQEDSIDLKIRNLEDRLNIIHQELELLKAKKKIFKGKPRTLIDLKGIWKGKGNFSEEEIEAAKIRVKDFPT